VAGARLNAAIFAMVIAMEEDAEAMDELLTELSRRNDLRVTANRGSWEAASADLKVGQHSWVVGADPEWTPVDEEWVHLISTRGTDLTVDVRLGRTRTGLVATAVRVERAGGSVRTQDLRSVQLKSVLSNALMDLWDVVPADLPNSSRPGRRGYDDQHWRQIAALLDCAVASQPGAFVEWIRRTYPVSVRPSERTVRRWVATVKQMREDGQL
jgi:hypothetical protein